MPPSPPSSEPAAGLPPRAAAALETALPEARRRLSPRGFDHYLRGLDALRQMGRGEGVLLAWIEAAPAVARDLGEDVLPDLAAELLGFASRTSGAVIERILATAPLAARRLGDAGLFRAWLAFLGHLLARAPRGVRPMLDHLGELLDVLTLGGLRRWADRGADAHRADPAELDRYFALATEESRAVLRRERKGVLLVDVQRRLGMYLRALWGRDFALIPTAGDFETRAGLRPYAEAQGLHLPDALDDWRGLPGLDLYRAQVAHLAAHLAALRAPFPGDGLTLLQSLAVGLVEDARAEALAIARFPKLRAMWVRFHADTAPGIAGEFDRIARALIGEPAEGPLATWVQAEFTRLDPADADAALSLGLALADRLRGLAFSPQRDRPSCPYRCDNRILWDFAERDWETAPVPAAAPQRRRHVSVSEMVNAVEVETAGDDAQEIWVQASEFFDDDGTTFNARGGREPVLPPVLYDEYDHAIGLMRPAWATVLDRRAPPGDPALADAILARHRKLLDRLRRRLDAMRPEGVQRLRKLEDGDRPDLEAAVRAAVDLRLGRAPDPRVMMRQVRRTRDTAVLLLLDLSQSTNDPAGAGETVLDLTRAAAVLLAEAVDRVGDRLAIHGFCSDGRHEVRYSRFKDFADPWGPAAKARLAGAEGQLSTRMGTAIRHATAQLSRVAAARRLLLVLTDGEPADIDVRDPHYLRADTRHAVDEARQAGVTPFCLTLDPAADAYAQRLFGARAVQVLDRVERLPERLPALYATLAG